MHTFFYFAALALVVFSLLVSFKVVDSERLIVFPLVFFLVFSYMLMLGASLLGSAAFAFTLALMCILKEIVLSDIFLKFKSIYAVVVFPGVFLWLVHHFVSSDLFYIGQVSPGVIPNQMKVEMGQGYAIYPFAVVLDYMLARPFYRMSGPFDEPGVVGTVSALVLSANRYRVKSTSDLVVLASGLLSFSLAFYLISLVYLVITNAKSIKGIFLVLFLLLSSFALLSQSEVLSSYTIDRMSIVDGRLSGDNRSNEVLDAVFDDWLASPLKDFLFGNSDGLPSGVDGSSIKITLIKSGIFGVLLLVVIYFVVFLRLRKSLGLNFYLVAFLVVFLLSAYQRPQVVAPVFFFIFMAGLLNSSNGNKVAYLRSSYSNGDNGDI
jgi:hypothetical protein